MGLMSTDLAKPYAVLRPSNLSWVLLPHNSVRGQQIRLAGRTRTQTGTLLQYMVLGFYRFAPCHSGLTYKGDLALGIPLLLHIHPSSGYIHPQQASVASTPNPLQNLQGLPNLPLFKLLVGAFQFSCWLALPETPTLPAPALVDAYPVSELKAPDLRLD